MRSGRHRNLHRLAVANGVYDAVDRYLNFRVNRKPLFRSINNNATSLLITDAPKSRLFRVERLRRGKGWDLNWGLPRVLRPALLLRLRETGAVAVGRVYCSATSAKQFARQDFAFTIKTNHFLLISNTLQYLQYVLKFQLAPPIQTISRPRQTIRSKSKRPVRNDAPSRTPSGPNVAGTNRKSKKSASAPTSSQSTFAAAPTF